PPGVGRDVDAQVAGARGRRCRGLGDAAGDGRLDGAVLGQVRFGGEDGPAEHEGGGEAEAVGLAYGGGPRRVGGGGPRGGGGGGCGVANDAAGAARCPGESLSEQLILYRERRAALHHFFKRFSDASQKRSSHASAKRR